MLKFFEDELWSISAKKKEIFSTHSRKAMIVNVFYASLVVLAQVITFVVLSSKYNPAPYRVGPNVDTIVVYHCTAKTSSESNSMSLLSVKKAYSHIQPADSTSSNKVVVQGDLSRTCDVKLDIDWHDPNWYGKTLRVISHGAVVEIVPPPGIVIPFSLNITSEDLAPSRVLLRDTTFDETARIFMHFESAVIFVQRLRFFRSATTQSASSADDDWSNNHVEIYNHFGPIFIKDDLTTAKNPAGFLLKAYNSWKTELPVVSCAPQVRSGQLFEDGVTLCNSSETVCKLPVEECGDGDDIVCWNLLGSNPTHFNLTTSSIYIVNDGEFPYYEGSIDLNTTDPELHPFVTESLKNTGAWVAEGNTRQFVEIVEIVSPAIGMIYAVSNKDLLLRFGPETLAFMSGFVLQPAYRRVSSVLSQYGCDRSQRYTFRENATLSNVGDLGEENINLQALLDEYISRKNRIILYDSIANMTDPDITTAFTTPPLEVHDSEHYGWSYYKYVREHGKMVVKELDFSSADATLIAFSWTLSMAIALSILAQLVIFRHSLCKVLFLRELREMLRVSVDEQVPRCPYKRYAALQMGFTWLAFHITRYIRMLINDTFFRGDHFREYLKSTYQIDDEETAAVISVSDLLQRYQLLCKAHLFMESDMTTDDYVSILQETDFGNNNQEPLSLLGSGTSKKPTVDNIPVEYAVGLVRAKTAIQRSASTATKNRGVILDGKYVITDIPSDELNVNEVLASLLESKGSYTLRDVRKELVAANVKLIKRNEDCVLNLSYSPNRLQLSTEVIRTEAYLSGNPILSLWIDRSSVFGLIARAGYTALQLAIFACIAWIPMFAALAVVLSHQEEHSKYSTIPDVVHVTGVRRLILNFKDMPTPFHNFFPDLFFMFIVVFALASWMESTLMVVFRGVSFIINSIGRRDTLSKVPVGVRYVENGLRVLVTFTAVSLYTVMIFYLLTFGVQVITWWVLGAIIMPEKMLAFTTSAITLIGGTFTVVSSLRSSRKTVMERLRIKCLEEVSKLLRSASGSIGCSSVEADYFDQSFKGKNADDSSAAPQVEITAGMLLDVSRGDKDATAQLAIALNVPPFMVQLSLGVVKNDARLIQGAIDVILESLNIPEELHPIIGCSILRTLKHPVTSLQTLRATYPLIEIGEQRAAKAAPSSMTSTVESVRSTLEDAQQLASRGSSSDPKRSLQPTKLSVLQAIQKNELTMANMIETIFAGDVGAASIPTEIITKHIISVLSDFIPLRLLNEAERIGKAVTSRNFPALLESCAHVLKFAEGELKDSDDPLEIFLAQLAGITQEVIEMETSKKDERNSVDVLRRLLLRIEIVTGLFLPSDATSVPCEDIPAFSEARRVISLIESALSGTMLTGSNAGDDSNVASHDDSSINGFQLAGKALSFIVLISDASANASRIRMLFTLVSTPTTCSRWETATMALLESIPSISNNATLLTPPVLGEALEVILSKHKEYHQGSATNRNYVFDGQYMRKDVKKWLKRFEPSSSSSDASKEEFSLLVELSLWIAHQRSLLGLMMSDTMEIDLECINRSGRLGFDDYLEQTMNTSHLDIFEQFVRFVRSLFVTTMDNTPLAGRALLLNKMRPSTLSANIMRMVLKSFKPIWLLVPFTNPEASASKGTDSVNIFDSNGLQRLTSTLKISNASNTGGNASLFFPLFFYCDLKLKLREDLLTGVQGSMALSRRDFLTNYTAHVVSCLALKIAPRSTEYAGQCLANTVSAVRAILNAGQSEPRARLLFDATSQLHLSGGAQAPTSIISETAMKFKFTPSQLQAIFRPSILHSDVVGRLLIDIASFSEWDCSGAGAHRLVSLISSARETLSIRELADWESGRKAQANNAENELLKALSSAAATASTPSLMEKRVEKKTQCESLLSDFFETAKRIQHRQEKPDAHRHLLEAVRSTFNTPHVDWYTSPTTMLCFSLQQLIWQKQDCHPFFMEKLSSLLSKSAARLTNDIFKLIRGIGNADPPMTIVDSLTVILGLSESLITPYLEAFAVFSSAFDPSCSATTSSCQDGEELLGSSGNSLPSRTVLVQLSKAFVAGNVVALAKPLFHAIDETSERYLYQMCNAAVTRQELVACDEVNKLHGELLFKTPSVNFSLVDFAALSSSTVVPRGPVDASQQQSAVADRAGEDAKRCLVAMFECPVSCMVMSTQTQEAAEGKSSTSTKSVSSSSKKTNKKTKPKNNLNELMADDDKEMSLLGSVNHDNNDDNDDYGQCSVLIPPPAPGSSATVDELMMAGGVDVGGLQDSFAMIKTSQKLAFRTASCGLMLLMNNRTGATKLLESILMELSEDSLFGSPTRTRTLSLSTSASTASRKKSMMMKRNRSKLDDLENEETYHRNAIQLAEARILEKKLNRFVRDNTSGNRIVEQALSSEQTAEDYQEDETLSEHVPQRSVEAKQLEDSISAKQRRFDPNTVTKQVLQRPLATIIGCIAHIILSKTTTSSAVNAEVSVLTLLDLLDCCLQVVFPPGSQTDLSAPPARITAAIQIIRALLMDELPDPDDIVTAIGTVDGVDVEGIVELLFDLIDIRQSATVPDALLGGTAPTRVAPLAVATSTTRSNENAAEEPTQTKGAIALVLPHISEDLYDAFIKHRKDIRKIVGAPPQERPPIALRLMIHAAHLPEKVETLSLLLLDVVSGKTTATVALLDACGSCTSPDDVAKLQTTVEIVRSFSKSPKIAAAQAASTFVDHFIDHIFTEFDDTGTGQLSFSAFQTILARLHIDTSTTEQKKVFAHADADNSGFISKREFRSVLDEILERFQKEALSRVNLTTTNIVVTVALLVLYMSLFFAFILTGVAALGDGTDFNTVITGALPMLGGALSKATTPEALDQLIQTAERALEITFERMHGT